MRLLTLLILGLWFNVCYASLLWHTKTTGPITGAPKVFKQKLYVTSGKLLSIYSLTGQLISSNELPATSFSEPNIDNDGIYVLTTSGVVCYDHLGNVQWFFRSEDRPLMIEGETWGWGKGKVADMWAIYRSAPVINGNTVIFANSNGTYALDKYSGKQLWHQATGVTHTKPAINKNTVVVGSWNNTLYTLALDTGTIKWQFTARTPQGRMGNWQGWQGFNLSPLIHENTVYVGSRGTYFYALDLASGNERWSTQYSATWIGSSAVFHNNQIYFGTSDGYSLVGLHAKRGAQTLLHLNDFYNFATPAAHGDHIYYGSMSGQVYQVNTKTMQGRQVFATPESKRNYNKLVKDTGGLKLNYSAGDNYNYRNAKKDIDAMFNKLNSILSMTIYQNLLFIGTANGDIYTVEI